jgi:predicted permease
MLRKWFQTVRFALRRRDEERLMDDEIRYHIEQETRENIRRGMSPEEARRTALLDFGGIAQVEEECREMWGVQLISDLLRDLRFGWRGLRRNKGYALAAILTLALGIGSNTALFSVLRSVVLRPLPVRDGDRVMILDRVDQETRRSAFGFSLPEMQFYRAHSTTMEDLAEFHQMSFILLGRKEAQNVETAVVGANYFDFFGLKPLYGRAFLPGEDQHGAEPVLVLSHRYFVSSFEGDPNVVGTKVRMNDREHRIVGVMPPLPEFPRRIDVYMPTSSCPTRSSEHFEKDSTSGLLQLYGRLKPGVTIDQARADYERLVADYRAAYPGAYPAVLSWRPRLIPLGDELARQAQPVFLLLFGITGLVLLIACASVANLTLARMLRRGREIAVRSALGASPARLLQQFAIEGLLVSGLGGLLGLAAATQSMSLLAAFAARLSPRAYDIRLDSQVLWFCVLVSILTGVFACGVPAWRARGNPSPAAREGAGHSMSVARQRARRVLVSAQVAFSFAVLIAAGLLLRSFVKLVNVDPGFQPRSVVAIDIHPNWIRIHGDDFREFFEGLVGRIRQLPDVMAAGVGDNVPLEAIRSRSRRFLIDRGTAPAQAADIDAMIAGTGYFQALGVPVLAGRDFTASDRDGAPLVAIVNQTMAQRYWPGQNPVGQRFRAPGFDSPEGVVFTVAGVVGDVRSIRLEDQPREQIYMPFGQVNGGVCVVVRGASDADTTIARLRDAVQKFDPEAAIAAARKLEDVVSDNTASAQVSTRLIGLLAALTLVITLAGIGGVAAVAANQRRTEVGIRLAMGAHARGLVAMIARQEMRMVMAGLAVGVVAALALSRLIATFLFGVPPNDPVTFALAAALLLATATLACVIPAIRAVRQDAFENLRSE